MAALQPAKHHAAYYAQPRAVPTSASPVAPFPPLVSSDLPLLLPAAINASMDLCPRSAIASTAGEGDVAAYVQLSAAGVVRF